MGLKDVLKTRVCEVTFIKKDGSEREMVCTLINDLLPETKGNKKELPDNLITVFDLEIQEWRMINLDTLISWSIVE